MTQERRRYGFVLERQCSLAKHYLSYHTHGVSAYHENLEKWSEVAKTREFLPESVENIFSNRLRVNIHNLYKFYTSYKSFMSELFIIYSKFPYGKTKTSTLTHAVHISTRIESASRRS